MFNFIIIITIIWWGVLWQRRWSVLHRIRKILIGKNHFGRNNKADIFLMAFQVTFDSRKVCFWYRHSINCHCYGRSNFQDAISCGYCWWWWWGSGWMGWRSLNNKRKCKCEKVRLSDIFFITSLLGVVLGQRLQHELN